MGKNRFSPDRSHVLGAFGLFLMLLVAKLASPAYGSPATLTGRLGSMLARQAINAIAAIGWLFDRFPLRHEGPMRQAAIIGCDRIEYRVTAQPVYVTGAVAGSRRWPQTGSQPAGEVPHRRR